MSDDAWSRAHDRPGPAHGRPGSSHLLDSFVAACRSAGARAPVVDVEAAGMDLLRRWGDDSRGYHDLEHLEEVLDGVRRLEPTASPEVVLAAWFHDAVYEGAPGDDERRSAELALAELTALGLPEKQAWRVAELVLVTTDHDPAAGDRGAAVLCDADLAVLAAGPERYERYVDGVRREYAHVPETAFASGRAAVLRALLAHPSMFRTATARGLWEEAARRNVTRELRRLEACGQGR